MDKLLAVQHDLVYQLFAAEARLGWGPTPAYRHTISIFLLLTVLVNH